MIWRLPSRPVNSWVSADRLDDLADLAVVGWSPTKALSGRSRARTSCWVIVEAPRPLPDAVADRRGDDADRVEAGVAPERPVLDRVVASTSTGESWAKTSMTWRWVWPKRASSTLPVRS